MSTALKTKLIVLALILPLSFSFAGYLIGENSYLLGLTFHNKNITLLITGCCFVFGSLLNLVCIYRKLFAIAMYQTPIPLTFFLIFWWIAQSISNIWIASLIGIIGLIIGLWLNTILVMPYQFFKIKKRVLAILYLFYSLFILGIFMGVPIFNLILGIFAGNYLAIRIMSYVRSPRKINQHIHQGALFSSIVLLFISGIAVWLAVIDPQSYLDVFNAMTQLKLSNDKFMWIIILLASAGVIFQYFITRFTAYTMLDLYRHRKTV